MMPSEIIMQKICWGLTVTSRQSVHEENIISRIEKRCKDKSGQ